MAWQRRARLGVALAGVGIAVAIYTSIGDREAQPPPVSPERLDPEAVIESSGAQLAQDRGSQRDFDVTSERQLTYEDGSTRLLGVEIVVRGRAGRDFVLTGLEAVATADQQGLELTGDVALTANDGLVVKAETATFNREDGIVRAPGPVAFVKGGLSGSGRGMTYDEFNDVLSILQQVRLSLNGADADDQMDVTAGAAVLRRSEHELALDGRAHLVRSGQIIDGDRALARLSQTDDVITFLELRGNGGVAIERGTLESMTARDIDLDYSDDGQALEQVVLTENASLLLRGEEGNPGRRLTGSSLDLRLAADGALLAVVGQEDIQFDLPARAGDAPRTVRSNEFRAAGEEGGSLRSANFSGDVSYREAAQLGSPARLVSSDALSLAFEAGDVTRALFTGGVRFEEQDLRASSAEALYQPAAGTLRLTGVEGGQPPRVTDSRIELEAGVVDLTLAGHRMNARQAVKTTLTPPPATAGVGDPPVGVARGAAPGLLDDTIAAYVNADALEYLGDVGDATYTGNAALWQGDTAIRADRITLDQERGNLVATGSARSNLLLDGDTSIGRAVEIRYDDLARMITYDSTPEPTGAPSTQLAQLSGPEGDLRAARIEVVLAAGASRADRLEAYSGVTARVDARIATGARLTYAAGEQQYTLSGDSTVPVTLVDACRTTTGRSLIFFRSTDRMIVDGNEELRTQTRTGPCSSPSTLP